MAQLPKFKTDNQELMLLQTQWAQFLNPIISLPILQQNTLKNVELFAGTNRINHGLQRKLQGWVIIRQRARSDIWDSQDTNNFPDLTLNLEVSDDVVVDLVVF